MNDTKIEWCDKTLNPVVGCSFNCRYCYARRIFYRFNKTGKRFEDPEFFSERLKQMADPAPSRIFLTSMSDPADWEPDWIKHIVAAMTENPQHQYLLLSKRPECYAKFWYSQGGAMWKPENVWFGATITQQDELGRLARLPMKRRFISIEPILEPIDLSDRPTRAVYAFADWVILGAETGFSTGKVMPKWDWIKQIVDYCDAAGVPVFMKDSLVDTVGEENMRRAWPPGLRKEEDNGAPGSSRPTERSGEIVP